MIDQNLLIQAANRYGVPPALLFAVDQQGNANPTGLGLDGGSDPLLQASMLAASMADLFTKYGDWQQALSAYYSGDPTKAMAPNSDVGGLVQATLAIAGTNSSMGLAGNTPLGTELSQEMFGVFQQNVQGMSTSGGVVTAQHASALQSHVGDWTPGGLGAPLAAAARQNGNTYPWGQCTYYAAQSLGWVPNQMGNASDWAKNAARKGFTVNNTPTVGSVVVYGAGGNYSHQYGHVAVVTAVNPDGTFQVSEMNVNGLGVVDSRKSSPSDVIGFIQAPPGHETQAAVTALHQDQQQNNGKGTPANSFEASLKPPVQHQQQQPDPNAKQIDAFAAEAKSYGLTPDTFQKYGQWAMMHNRYGLDPSSIKEFSHMLQINSDAEMMQHVAGKSHPTYPEIPVGEFAKTYDQAMLWSLPIAGRAPNPSEVARLWKAGSKTSDIQDYFHTLHPQTDSASGYAGNQAPVDRQGGPK